MAQPEGNKVERRTFLKMAGTAAAAAPGIALVSGLLDGQQAAAAAGAPAGSHTATQAAAEAAAEATRTTARTPAILLGGAEVRPPSVPLAVRSP